MFDKFYKHSSEKRKEILKSINRFDEALDTKLPTNIYESMIENSIGTYEIPMGVVPNVLVNGISYIVPMVTEEPSVIAAQSNASKIFANNGGVKAEVISRLMRGEIAIPDEGNGQAIIDYIENNQERLIDLSNRAYPSIVKRGGGVRKIQVRYIHSHEYTSFVVVDIFMDTQEAMGANMINSVLETLKSHLEVTLGIDPLMAILSNLADTCMVEATVTLDVNTLKFPDTIARKIELASDLAHVDIYRAATHNKGIMNGIDAVVIATGNDFRAVEAGAHAYASIEGEYKPLTSWKQVGNTLVGKIALPLAIGTVGGTIKTNPKAQQSYTLLNTYNSLDLMMIIASVGLAQNFAALYALTTDGIQKGHMRMHARTLLINEGCPQDILDEAVLELIKVRPFSSDDARRIISNFKGI